MVQLAHHLFVCVCIANTEGSEWPTILQRIMELQRNAEKSLKLQKLVQKSKTWKTKYSNRIMHMGVTKELLSVRGH